MNGDSLERQRLLLLTANVGSLFEEGQRLQQTWLEVISEKLKTVNADFIVVHMQETGGKHYVECSAQVPVLIRELADRLHDSHPLCRSYLDLNYTAPSYTALGSTFFISKDLVKHVEHYDFVRGSFSPIPTEEEVQIRTDGLDNECHAIKKKFPKHFWPALKWGRKGYLQTRWRIHGKVMDFINVHLFHDESNLALIHENPSLYSSNRKRALDYVLEQSFLDGDTDDIQRHASHPTTILIFAPSDISSEISTSGSILEHSSTDLPTGQRLIRWKTNINTDPLYPPHPSLHVECQQDLLKDAEFARAKDLLGAPDLRRTVSAIEFRRDDGESNENCVLRIEKKRFDYFNHVKLLAEWQSYLEDDKEISHFPNLHELPISFPPTYPWSEDPLDSGALMKTRAPAWCDRVLLNDSAFKDLDVSTVNYESLGKQQCMGDHKPVLLELDFTV